MTRKAELEYLIPKIREDIRATALAVNTIKSSRDKSYIKDLQDLCVTLNDYIEEYHQNTKYNGSNNTD